MEFWIKDLRVAVRSLSARPGFAMIAILTLTLGIGMNTLIFSLVDAVLLSPLPFRSSDELVNVWETYERRELQRRAVGYPTYQDWRRQNQVFEDITVFLSSTVTFTGTGTPLRIEAQLVDPNFFDLLGITAARGRLFEPADNESYEQPPRAILGQELWIRLFGSDPGILGRQIPLNGISTEIVGVLPQGFAGIDGDRELWLPVRPGARLAQPGSSFLSSRSNRGLRSIARLRGGVTLEQAQENLDAMMVGIREQFPDRYVDRGALVVPLEEDLLGDTQESALLLLAAVAVVLAIACANVANLIMARTAGRRAEISLRIALGAGKGRLIRQLLTESLALSLLGGALGTLLAWWGTDLLHGQIPFQWPDYVSPGMSWNVLGFTLILCIGTAVLFGLAPALAAYRKGLSSTLSSGRGASGIRGSGRGAGGWLVVAEVALSIVVLTAAGLLLRSFFAQQSIHPGFDPQRLLTLEIELPASEYDARSGVRFVEQFLDRVRNLSGVTAAGISTDTPLASGYSARSLLIEDHLADDPDAGSRIYWHSITPGYLQTLGANLLAGRDFVATDTAGSPGVVIISQQMAEESWPGEHPLGKRVSRNGEDWLTVVGVVANIRHRSLVEQPQLIAENPDVYFPLTQLPRRNLALAVRTRETPETLVEPIRQTVLEIDPNLPVFNTATMQDILSQELATSRTTSQLISLFGILALVLASIGIYGVLANLVTERRQEIGIRIALGAHPREVLRLVMRHGLVMTLVGTVFGLALSISLNRLIANFLYRTSPADPATLASVCLLFLAVAALATYLPARKAVRIDPIETLRT